MPRSLNVRFNGPSPPDPDDPDPPGAGIARAVEAGLRRRGLPVERVDNWRDAGWVIAYGSGLDALDIALAGTSAQERVLQVSARASPGLLARLMGRPAPARGPAIYELARSVSAALLELGFTGMGWRWDGPPREGDPPEPPAPA
jgi:hypothetical protein